MPTTTQTPSARRSSAAPRRTAAGSVLPSQTLTNCARAARLAVLCLLILTTAATAAAQSDSCEGSDVGVPIGFKASTCTHRNFALRLNGADLGGVISADCRNQGWQSTPLTYMQLVPHKTYTLTSGNESCSTHINFMVPDGYWVEIDGKRVTSLDKGDGTRNSGDGSWKLVVRGGCPCEGKISLPGSGAARLGSVLWGASLGKLSDGRSAESLSLREEFMTSAVYSPSALVYSPPAGTSEVVVVHGASSIRQIKAPEIFADIVTLSSSEYEIRFYRPEDVGTRPNNASFYPVTGTPLVIWRFKNPDPATTSRLQISKIQGGATETSEYTWNATANSWSLSSGNGSRIETRTSATDPATGHRIETTTVKDAGGAVARKVVRTFRNFPWGEELIKEVSDPDVAALTTVYAYYEDPAHEGRYRKLQSVVRPDGSWEKYDYDGVGNKTQMMRPWKDQALGTATPANSRVTSYYYTNNDGRELSLFARHLAGVEERVAGVLVRRTTYDRSAISVNGQPAVTEVVTTYSSASVGQVTKTTTYHHTAAASHAGRVASVVEEDGRKATYTYEKGNFTANQDPSLSTFTPAAGGAAERTSVVYGTEAAPDGVALRTTKDVTITDGRGRAVLRETYVYTGTGYERVGWKSFSYDDRGNETSVVSHSGEVTTAAWSGDLKQSEVDQFGTETVYSYDSLGRIRTKTRKGVASGGGFPAQPDLTTTYTYDAEGRVTVRTDAGGGLSLTNSTEYDLAGRVKGETNATQLRTSHVYADGGRTHTVTLPGGAIRVTTSYLDGQTKSVAGSASFGQYFEYGVNADGSLWSQEFAGPGGVNSPRWSKVTKDWLGRVVQTERPVFEQGVTMVESAVYNARGQLQSRSRKSGAARLLADRLYEYDDLGSQVREGTDVDANGALAPSSADRISESEVAYEKAGSDWFRVTTAKTYLVEGSGAATATRVRKERLNNFTAEGTEKTTYESLSADAAGNQTSIRTKVDRAARKVTVTTDTPSSANDEVSITVNELLQSVKPATSESATTFTYDGLGRLVAESSPHTGTASRSFDPADGHLASVTHGANTVTYEYYPPSSPNAGLVKSSTNAAGKKTYFVHSFRGELLWTWGDATYPIRYIYDEYGQKIETHTFRGGTRWGEESWPDPKAPGVADVTTWVYNEPTGLLERSLDASGKEVAYSYDALGRLQTRSLARTEAGGPVTATYTYDPETGEMSGINYSDSTPDISLGYDRAGRRKSTTDAAGTHTLTYNGAGQLETDAVVGGILDGAKVSLGYDGFLRRQSLGTYRGTTLLTSQTYGYDSSSRLATITSGGQSATYSYHPARGVLTGTTFTGGAAVTRSYETQGRLESATTTPATGAPLNYTYAYDDLDQRTRVTREDGSYWAYDYNARGEVMSGKKYWSDGSQVAGQQTEYAYDTIGNRLLAKAGGDAQGGKLRQSTYAPNALNQYVQRTAPGFVNVTGASDEDATVTVNEEPAYRRGQYFQRELAVDNGAVPVYQPVRVLAVRNGVGAQGQDVTKEESGHAYVPKFFESYVYDADGNLTQDGRWRYVWDAENRLASMEAIPGVPAEARLRLEFAYDYVGRRIQKKVYGWNAAANAYQLTSTAKYVYDGWNLVAELDGANALRRSYIWGQDLSGTQGDMGGIGGLLFIGEGSATYQVGYDGGGNVTALIKAETGATGAVYDYDPFGQAFIATGNYAAANPFRFNTKYADAETNLIYYGHRYYNPQTGRWLSRDPLGEEGGINLYGFVSNNPVGKVDALGLYEEDVHYYLTYFLALKTECLMGWEANDIATEDQMVDEDPSTWPGFGYNGPQQMRNRVYHALHPGAAEGVGPSTHWQMAMNEGSGSHKWIGRYLHYLQDTFSHSGYDDAVTGHSPLNLYRHLLGANIFTVRSTYGDHLTDKTAADQPKARRMVGATWKALLDYVKAKKCNCKTEWDDSWWGPINDFIKVETNAPRRASIDAKKITIDNLALGDPEATLKKRRLLGLPDRAGQW